MSEGRDYSELVERLRDPVRGATAYSAADAIEDLQGRLALAEAALEDDLLGLLKGEHSSLLLGFNELNGPNYVSVAKALDEGIIRDIDWISEDERAKARATNRCWTLQWYPDTPVGCYTIAASSLPVLLAAINARNTSD